MVYPDGTRIADDNTITTPDGTEIELDGSKTYMNGTRVDAETGEVRDADGTLTLPSGDV